MEGFLKATRKDKARKEKQVSKLLSVSFTVSTPRNGHLRAENPILFVNSTCCPSSTQRRYVKGCPVSLTLQAEGPSLSDTASAAEGHVPHHAFLTWIMAQHSGTTVARALTHTHRACLVNEQPWNWSYILGKQFSQG